MARQALIRALRTTQAALDSNAGASNLNEGEPYYITDTDELAVGTSASTYTVIGGLSSVTSDSTLTGDGTSGSPLGVNTAQGYNWSGAHTFDAGDLKLDSFSHIGVFTASLSTGQTWTMPNHTGDIPVCADAGDSFSQAAVQYNGLTKAAGRFYGGTTTPTNSDRLNYDGYFYATAFSAGDADSTLQKTSGWIGLGRGVGGVSNFFVDDTECSAGVPLNAYSALALLKGRITNTDTGEVNNWNPAGLADASWIIWNGTSALGVSGMQGGVDGRIVVISTGTSSLVGIDFYHQNTGSTAANRFILPESGTLSLGPAAKAAAYRSAVFAYDGGVSRWRLIARNF